VLIHCESREGIGHYVRTLSIARAFSERGWQVAVVMGQRDVKFLNISDDIRTYWLPELSHKYFNRKKLKSRADSVIKIIKFLRPNWFVTEHFPFGRWKMALFYRCLMSFLKPMRATGEIRVAGSVRDIITWNKWTSAHYKRVEKYIAINYDVILVHSDPAICSWRNVAPAPLQYLPNLYHTGFVCPKSCVDRHLDAQTLARFKKYKERGNFLILASAGGGNGAFSFLRKVIDSVALVNTARKVFLLVVCGPLLPRIDRLHKKLKGLPQGELIQCVSSLGPYLKLCDLSVSHLGYNTAVELLMSNCEAIVIPMRREYSEQLARCKAIGNSDRFTVLSRTDDLDLAINKIICKSRNERSRHPRIRCDGARESVSLLSRSSESTLKSNLLG